MNEHAPRERKREVFVESDSKVQVFQTPENRHTYMSSIRSLFRLRTPLSKIDLFIHVILRWTMIDFSDSKFSSQLIAGKLKMMQRLQLPRICVCIFKISIRKARDDYCALITRDTSVRFRRPCDRNSQPKKKVHTLNNKLPIWSSQQCPIEILSVIIDSPKKFGKKSNHTARL